MVCDEKGRVSDCRGGNVRGIPRLENRDTWGTRVKRSRTVSAVRQATSRKAREVAYPQLFRSMFKDKPALYSPVKVAHPPGAPSFACFSRRVGGSLVAHETCAFTSRALALEGIGSIAAHPCKKRKDGAPTVVLLERKPKPKGGPPSITVSALSRDTWTSEGFWFFPSWKVLVLLLVLLLLMRPRPAFRIARWKLGSTNHLSGHCRSDHDSLFRLPDLFREARRPISPTMSYSFTRVAPGLPCMRTSCA